MTAQELGVRLNALAAFRKLVTCECPVVLSDDSCLAHYFATLPSSS